MKKVTFSAKKAIATSIHLSKMVIMRKYTPLAFEINLCAEGFVFEVGSLFEAFASLHDQRDARGVRYALTTILVCVILAKLAGYDSLRGIAQWIRLHHGELQTWLGLPQWCNPHATTLSRILGQAIDVTEFERIVGAFFAALPTQNQERQLILDGKRLRGTRWGEQRPGVHLLAAYLPGEGWVALQIEVTQVENEIPAARRIVKMLDLRGKIVTGDALLAQRTLSAEIVKGGGEYLRTLKNNQPETFAAVQELFAPEPCVPGFSPASDDDFQTVDEVGKGHARIEKRILTVSAALNE